MKKNRQLKAFSLVEVIIAMGILAVSMIFILGAFPLAILWNNRATEKTIASCVAKEAFAKVKFYAVGAKAPDVNSIADNILYGQIAASQMADFADGSLWDFVNPPQPETFGPKKDDFVYPTDGKIANYNDKQYSWMALCRYLTPYNPAGPVPDVQMTVFICRKTSSNQTYYDGSQFVNRPVAVKIAVTKVAADVLRIDNVGGAASVTDDRPIFKRGAVIVDDATGEVYRIREIKEQTSSNVEARLLVLDRDFNSTSTDIWVVAPAAKVNGGSIIYMGKNPCVGVYQKIMKL